MASNEPNVRLAYAWDRAKRPNVNVISTIEELALSLPTIQSQNVPYFSQCAEDQIVAALIRARHGVDFDFTTMRYIDIGANHPVNTSNTWLFYTLGAKGVLVEPNKVLARQLAIARPRDSVVTAAIKVDQRTSIEFHVATYHELSSTDLDFLKTMMRSKGGIEKGFQIDASYTVDAVDINEVVQADLASQPVTLLSVDTEGVDLKVLMSVDYTKWKPEFIIVEPSDELVGVDSGSASIMRFLNDKGYELKARTRVNMVFGAVMA